ncbi:MFS transporter [Bradyrhizobium sp. G127]|uniref:MFS transporter n=1 Tax=Bradyrhizobium sp. G127 TaxID=2904800 RepID=UPI001F4421C0|nr:MFS transporter [Bradyrhizobium sp. G127]
MRISLFYASTFGIIGVHLPFFPVWLKAIGVDVSWIGIITAAPSLSRFTILPFVTASAERHQVLRGTMIALAFVTAVGFAVLGLLRDPLTILIAYAVIACLWTPLSPLTDGYALKGVTRHGLDYARMRLWGSASFVVFAMVAGLLFKVIDPQNLIWIIVAVALLSALVGLGIVPLDAPASGPAPQERASGLLRMPLFLAIIGASALIQGSHAAYYAFSSITWQDAGFGGFTIAALWSLGVVAEIVVFAISPRLTLSPTVMVLIGAMSGVLRWTITAQEPRIEVLTAVQLMHGLTFGITQVGTVALMVRSVPHHMLASAQGYMVASQGAVTSLTMMLSGLIYARVGEGVYYAMAMMALAGGIVMAVSRRRLDAHHGS